MRSAGRSSSARIAAAYLAALALAPAARAQVPTIPVEPLSEESPPPAEPTRLESVVVTGSRLARADYETAQPVLVITREDIERSGITSIGDLLQELPIAGTGSSTRVVTNDVGTVEADLRNLGAQRVLVLVNGRRWIGGMFFYSTSSVDLSNIPISIIERVEVLKDGASAIYGSDAIAGVINVITRKDYEGAELRARLGGYTSHVGRNDSYGVTWGRTRGDRSMFLDLSYVRDHGIANDATEITRFPKVGVGPTRGSYFTPRGTLGFVPTPANAAILGPELCPAEGPAAAPFCGIITRHGQTITGAPTETTATVAPRYEPFNTTSFDESVNDLFNFNALTDYASPNDRTALFGTFNQALGSAVDLQLEFLYGQRRVPGRSIPLLVFGDFAGSEAFLAADQAYNPFDQDIGRTDPTATTGVGSGIVLRVLTEAAAPTQGSVELYRVGGALSGHFDALGRAVAWDLAMSLARSRHRDERTRRFDPERLARALGPAADCMAADGCVPLNALGGPGSITAEMLGYLLYETSYPKRQALDNVLLTVSHDWFRLPAGFVSGAHGLEYRNDRYSDGLVDCRQDCFLPTSGEIPAVEAFTELGVPLLAGLPLVEILETTLALRHSRYDGFGSATTYKAGLRWKPLGSVLVRATRSTAFRAPSVGDLFLTPATFEYFLFDPCDDYTGAGGGEPAEPTVQENCRSAGVPEDYDKPDTELTPVSDGGNLQLQPETADITTAGIVASPQWIDGLDLYVDWYRIELDDSITLLPPQFALDACYQAPGGGQTCSRVERDRATGRLTRVLFQPINIGGNRVSGVDLGFDYALPGLEWLVDSPKLRIDASYLIDSATLLAKRTGGLDAMEEAGTSNGFNAYPRWRANATLGGRRGPWQASWSARYVHRMTEPCDDGVTPSFTELGLCSQPDPATPSLSRNDLGARTYHDLQLGFGNGPWGIDFSGGIYNVLDQDPPSSYGSYFSSFDPSVHELPGRAYWFRLARSF